MTKFELTVLGTSSALPTSQRYPTAHVLNVHERFFLIDCGEGTQMQMRKTRIGFNHIDNIFISHLHGDHILGLMGLISTLSLTGRTADLHIYSHSQLFDILKPQIDFSREESDFKIIWHPLDFKKECLIYEDKALAVTSFPLKHRIPCCGFVFREKERERNIDKEMIKGLNIPIKCLQEIKRGADFTADDGEFFANSRLTIAPPKPRSYAFCSDTVFLPEIVEYIKDVDILYHEATYASALENRAKETMHSTSKQAATIAQIANVDKLLIGHFSARYKNISELENEAKSIFPNSEAAIDGKSYEIPFRRKE